MWNHQQIVYLRYCIIDQTFFNSFLILWIHRHMLCFLLVFYEKELVCFKAASHNKHTEINKQNKENIAVMVQWLRKYN